MLIGWSDAMSSRPATVLVFALSVGCLLVLTLIKGSAPMRLPAVVYAAPVAVHSLMPSTVAEHHVAVGDRVSAGQRLLTLDTGATRRGLELVERDIEALKAQLALQAAQLRADRQRDALDALRARQQLQQSLKASRARTEGSKHSRRAAASWRDNVRDLVEQGVEPRSALLEAEKEMADAHAIEKEAMTQARTSLEQSRVLDEVLQGFSLDDLTAQQKAVALASMAQLATRRAHLKGDLERAALKAHGAGRVALLAPLGARSDMAPQLALLVPESSHTLVAYMPATLSQGDIPAPGQEVRFGAACLEPGRIVRVGGAVEAAPEYLMGELPGVPLFGLPIFVEVPPSCPMTPGFVLQIEILP